MTTEGPPTVEALKAAYEIGWLVGAEPCSYAGERCPYSPQSVIMRRSWFDGFSAGRSSDTFIGTTGRYLLR